MLGMCSYKVPQDPSTTWTASLEVWITLYSRTFLFTIVLPYPTQYGLVSNIILCAGTGDWGGYSWKLSVSVSTPHGINRSEAIDR